jgi:hypothetical protein
MTDQTLPAGWVVQVATPGPLGDAPSFGYFNVAIADSDKAVEAIRRLAGGNLEAKIDTVRRLSLTEIATIPLNAGELKPA